MTDPTQTRPYLHEPNYYRLAYQLAAQQLNGAIAPWPREDNAVVPDLLGLTVEDALGPALSLIQNSMRLLSWYDEREAAYRWWRPWGARSLAPKERRLRRFVAETVEPCAELLAAGAYVLLGDLEQGELYAAGVRRLADQNAVSYRTFYNLACYDVALAVSPAGAEGAEQLLELGLRDLRAAVRRVHGRRRTELLRWAWRDPSLAPLRNIPSFSADFEAIVGPYEPPERKRESGGEAQSAS